MNKKKLFLKLLEIKIIKSNLNESNAIRLYEKASKISNKNIPEDITNAVYDYYNYYSSINHYGENPPIWTK